MKTKKTRNKIKSIIVFSIIFIIIFIIIYSIGLLVKLIGFGFMIIILTIVTGVIWWIYSYYKWIKNAEEQDDELS